MKIIFARAFVSASRGFVFDLPGRPAVLVHPPTLVAMAVILVAIDDKHQSGLSSADAGDQAAQCSQVIAVYATCQ